MAAKDLFSAIAHSITSSAFRAATIVPSDSDELEHVGRGLYVGSAGNAVVVFANGNEVTLTGLLAGVVYPFRIKQVKSTNTTASGLVNLW